MDSPLLVDAQTPWDSVGPEIEVFPAPLPKTKPIPIDRDSTEFAGGGAFTIPLICLGIGLIAMCLLIPAADENRRLAYEKERLQADLEQLQKQVATNDAFLKRVADDPTLAERLARRQMKMVPQGTQVLELQSQRQSSDLSPFLLVTVPPPPPMAPYKPVGGFLADACRHPKTQLYLIGGALMMIASGLVMSRSTPSARRGEGAGEGRSVTREQASINEEPPLRSPQPSPCMAEGDVE